MSDRELLELAAKGAGLYVCSDLDYLGLKEWGAEIWVKEEKYGEYRSWNPLIDDGDALRLAVKCNLSLMRVGTYPAAVINDAKLRDTTYYSEDCIRRPIVAAAAEIGKSLS